MRAGGGVACVYVCVYECVREIACEVRKGLTSSPKDQRTGWIVLKAMIGTGRCRGMSLFWSLSFLRCSHAHKHSTASERRRSATPLRDAAGVCVRVRVCVCEKSRERERD